MIEGFRIRNFGILRDVTVGRFHNVNVAHLVENDPLSPVTIVTGHVGSGKSTVIDAFLFLQNCFKHDVEYACELCGTFRNVTSASALSPIQFDICYRENPDSPLFRYYLSVGLDCRHRPFVAEETYGVIDEVMHEQTLHLRMENGEGFIGENIPPDDDIKDIREHEKCSKVSLSNNYKLGISMYGGFAKYSSLYSFFNFIDNWYFPKLDINKMRRLSFLQRQRHLSRSGDNITNVVYHMENQRPDVFAKIVAKLSLKNPNIKNATVEVASDGMGLLRFWRKDGESSFVQTISEGTLKWLAYLLLLYDSEPASLVCIDDSSLDIFPEIKDYQTAQIILTMPLRDAVIPSWKLIGEGLNILVNPYF
jgi:predicted ATPase